MLALPEPTATDILADISGQSLAVACKGSGLDRATFSALAVLTARNGNAAVRLDAFDQVPQGAADALQASGAPALIHFASPPFTLDIHNYIVMYISIAM